ncbi:branched-chain amino acid ABC transporter permease [Roseomonas sp. KE0001]|uniref:branched-chain amino acid ABC transporter permease n=1 Tax=unclassified Roseomonas TaxID=2617492 RepID=UPI0018DF342D|nr:branched-chain amino acid ABC transporter permease [Roseomonas sp. KE0001]MBI0432995.1 branched-chain amino acid ABC transporter permease [Roseomonas sp. KE0001]
MNLVQQLINGLIIGHAYALIAIGWTVLLGVARLVNFGHGQMYMLAAFVTWWGVAGLGLPYPLAILLAMAGGVLLGLVMQLTMLRLTFAQDLVSIMIVTLGFGHVMRGLAGLLFGGNPQVLETPLSWIDFEIAGAWVTAQDLLIVVAAIAVFLLLRLVLERGALGRTARMVAEDPKLAQLGGIDVRRVYLAVFAFEGAAVALAAALVAPRTPILTSIGFEEVIITFVVVVLGGIGSIGGSYLAGIGLGLFTALFGGFVSPAYATSAAFGVLILVLVLRPGGLALGAKGGRA